ncbi:uncharacterized protein LOC100113792 [Nasonia vitripennis]|uniref:Spermatogenesis-associated protein 6 N-terminal domain-containing protein n=1 Tax=Nasonia vitripennis TaxID=7425 RepID=A0A7M7Q065_NASVI|nr:uncharacterized protein LOC100113792 [Nasonia vitripennis]XP_031778243.1 uncharacterized protein LOC100113792 [Nasonia vitripennis]XP_032457340.1 uncharacterized protein LOC100113792 [Nasonia vitripennis]
MVGRAFSVKIDLDLHAVTCPGVWLCPNGKVALQINIFDSCIATHRLTPIFPLLYHNKFTFKKIFTTVTTLAELEKKLAEEYIFAELIQCSPTANRNVSLATFETNLVDLLYPVPCFKGLLAGVDVDLLMEPSTFFPGILAPKIEVSTRTTIEEVTNFHVRSSDGHVINPKIINSMNQRCIHKKKDPPPKQRIIRQKRVCHTGQGKLNNYICRCCRRQGTTEEGNCNCDAYNDSLRSSKDQCYLATSKRRQICSCTSPVKLTSARNYNVCNDAHILDSCPICLKYKCYFSNRKIDANNLSKLCDVTNCQNPYNKHVQSTTKLLSGMNCNTIKNCRKNVSKFSNDIDSLNLQNDMKSSNHKSCDGDTCCKSSSLENCKNSSIYRSNSAPSLQDDPTTSILLAKMRQLERTKERLNYANCANRYSDHNLSCKDVQNNESRKGFYKNLEKFYKRMYKQAKQRAQDLNET